MKDFIKKIISIVLTRESDNTIQESVFKFKNRNKRIFKIIYGSATDEEIFNNITQKLNEKFDILMIHSSLNDMLPMYTGNLAKLIDLIISHCDKHNITLVMPTFFLGSNLQAKEYYLNGKNKFDLKNTASGMGLLSEILRITPNVKRSLHPTHSVCARGPLADILTNSHHNADTACGEGTPFGAMLKYKTMILGIGAKSEHSLTQVHSAEDILKNDYPIPLYTADLPVKCIDETGNQITYKMRTKNPEYVLDRKSFFKILRKVKILKWKYKGIPFYLTNADDVTDTFIDAAKNGQIIYRKNT